MTLRRAVAERHPRPWKFWSYMTGWASVCVGLNAFALYAVRWNMSVTLTFCTVYPSIFIGHRLQIYWNTMEDAARRTEHPNHK